MRKHIVALAVLGLIVVVIILVATRNSSTASAEIGPCPVFPANNIWNARVDNLPLDAHSNDYINSMRDEAGIDQPLHPDFGSQLWEDGPIGIPYNTVPGTQPLVEIRFDPEGYKGESDLGPFPIPPEAKREWGSDHHVLVINQGDCMLYELYQASRQPDNSWLVYSSAKYDLRSNALRPDTWTSADAAGLPIFAGLVRYDEVASGEIKHAIRFTADITQKKHIWPARHDASDETDPRYPPMGQRFRLKQSFDISGFPEQARIVLQAMKTYGVILADNGSNWYIGGAPDPGWDDDQLVRWFEKVHGSDFEAVNESVLMVNPDSGEAGPEPVWRRLFLPLLGK